MLPDPICNATKNLNFRLWLNIWIYALVVWHFEVCFEFFGWENSLLDDSHAIAQSLFNCNQFGIVPEPLVGGQLHEMLGHRKIVEYTGRVFRESGIRGAG